MYVAGPPTRPMPVPLAIRLASAAKAWPSARGGPGSGGMLNGSPDRSARARKRPRGVCRDPGCESLRAELLRPPAVPGRGPISGLQPLERLAHRVDGLGREEHACHAVDDALCRTGPVERDDRSAGRHGLDRRDAEV